MWKNNILISIENVIAFHQHLINIPDLISNAFNITINTLNIINFVTAEHCQRQNYFIDWKKNKEILTAQEIN